MGNNLTSTGALAYQGTNAASPSNVTVHYNRPTPNYYQGFQIGDFWVYRVSPTTNANELWVLMGVAGNVANWVLLSTSTGVVLQLEGNTGGPVGPTAGIINVVGTGGVSVAGNPGTSTLTISASGTMFTESFLTDDTHVVTPTAGQVVLHGGNNITTAGTVGPNTVTINVSGTTNNALQIGNATGSLTSLAAATNGQIPIGNTGNNPTIATLTAGANVTITNGAGSITIAAASGTANAFNSINVQAFTTSGTYTPTSGMKYCTVEVIGAGGGGGGCVSPSAGNVVGGGGGGGGGYARKNITAATIGASQTVTIGAAGTAGSNAGGTGGTGGTSSLGALLSATGGAGGDGSDDGGRTTFGARGGAGGLGSSGDINAQGSPGGFGFGNVGAGTLPCQSGFGGSSYFGGGARTVSNNTDGTDAAGIAGGNYGGGGSGAFSEDGNPAHIGGAGAAGFIVITEYISS